MPVLSTQITVADPSVSMTAERRVRTWRCDMRQAPSARNTVSTTGNSSGSIAMAAPMPTSRPSSQSCRVSPNTMTTSAAATRPQTAMMPNEAAELALQRRACGFDVAQRRADAPSSVSAPVSATAAMPWPLTTSVPENTHGVASPPGAPIASAAASGRVGRLADRDRLAGERGLVDREVDAVDQHAVGGDAIALGEQHDVAADDVAAGDALLVRRRGRPAHVGEERSRSAASAFSVLCSW